ncbi:MAG: efflux RND transporter periplasmic adaptor subunit [Proteobacteria bacterium]|nr:efflux RND transporter periplasmic adaptor subunit [Pseudomonadota bacterium]
MLIFLTVLCSHNIFAEDILNSDNRFDCVIRPSLFVELSSQVRGVLESVEVERGDLVEKDQLIAKLMSGVETASVRLARARAEMRIDIETRTAEKALRKRSFKQVEKLYKKELASLREYDDAKTLSTISHHELRKAIELMHLAELELARTEETLSLRHIKSPISGVVVERLKSPGEFIEEQAVVKIAQINPLHVETIVSEDQFNRIKVGMKVKVYTMTQDQMVYDAHVTIVDPIIDAMSGTFGVRLELANPERKIPVGLRCEVSFDL